MHLFILPGFSNKNLGWVDMTQSQLDTEEDPAMAIHWDHWQKEKPNTDWKTQEVKKLLTLIGDKQINLVAKSIGTVVAMDVIKSIPNQINKVILCGVPVADLAPEDSQYYEPLREFPTERVLCIQNDNDNHGSYSEAERFLHNINPEVKIISMPRADHEYPYSQEFKKYLQTK